MNLNLRQLKNLYKDRTSLESEGGGPWHIEEKNQGFSFHFPTMQTNGGKVIIRHDDLESRIKVFLNGQLITRMDGESPKIINVDNISISGENIVRIENDGRPDYGTIYDVQLIGE